jgi:hypothetical protein
MDLKRIVETLPSHWLGWLCWWLIHPLRWSVEVD